MQSQTIIVANGIGKAAAYGLIRNLPNDGTFHVSVEKVEGTRNLAQNAAFHALVRDLATYSGHSFHEVKELVKARFLPPVSVEIGGELTEILPSTASLSVDEMSSLIGQTQALLIDVSSYE